MQGINHLTLSVRNLETSFRFYADVLGMRPVARWYKGAYLQAGGDWICLSLDDSTRAEPLPEYSHVAFTVQPSGFSDAVERLRQADVTVWHQNRSEGDSFYFLDPDGHKLELHVGDLNSRLAALQATPPRDLILFP